MISLRQAFNRFRAFLRSEQLDREVKEEMASHLEMAVEENLRRGMSAEEARRQALVRFGGVQQAIEQHRESRTLPWVDVLRQDLRFTFRMLRRDSGFTIVAVLILALGIGANIAVFSVVNTILLRPLPFRDPEQLVRIVEKDPKAGESSKTYTADATQDFQQQNHSFQSVSGYFAFTGPDNFKLVGNGQPTPVDRHSCCGKLLSDSRCRTFAGTFVQTGRIRATRPARCTFELSVLEMAARWRSEHRREHD